MLMKVTPLHFAALQRPDCATCDLRAGAFFRALNAAALAGAQMDIVSQSLAEDELLYGRADSGSSVFTIRSGVIRLERVTERGDRRVVRLAGRGDLIGQEALLHEAYRDDAVACTPVELCRIPRPLVLRLDETQPEVRLELMKRWQRALDESAAWSADLTTGPARRRLLKLLSLLARYPDGHGRIWLPRREDMGAMLDIAAETASRLVSQLRREKVIEPLPPNHARLQMQHLQTAVREADV